MGRATTHKADIRRREDLAVWEVKGAALTVIMAASGKVAAMTIRGAALVRWEEAIMGAWAVARVVATAVSQMVKAWVAVGTTEEAVVDATLAGITEAIVVGTWVEAAMMVAVVAVACITMAMGIRAWIVRARLVVMRGVAAEASLIKEVVWAVEVIIITSMEELRATSSTRATILTGLKTLTSHPLLGIKTVWAKDPLAANSNSLKWEGPRGESKLRRVVSQFT